MCGLFALDKEGVELAFVFGVAEPFEETFKVLLLLLQPVEQL